MLDSFDWFVIGFNVCISGKGGCFYICLFGLGNVKKCVCLDGLFL